MTHLVLASGIGNRILDEVDQWPDPIYGFLFFSDSAMVRVFMEKANVDNEVTFL